MPATFVESDISLSTRGEAVEPEVLDSIDEAERTRFGPEPAVRHVGCSLGPGCGCIGLPLMALAGLVLFPLVALLWVLSLGRLPASIARIARQVWRGRR